jgi:tRNA/rRNA methyltransferase
LESAHVCATLDEALVGCTLIIGLSARKRQLSHELVSARKAAIQAAEMATNNQQIALVFGTEMSGLSNAELDLCNLLAMIPTNPEYSSLNLAAAVQVMCYETRMALLDEHAALSDLPNNQIKPKQDKVAVLASSDEVEYMFKHLEETLTQIGFLNMHSPGRLMQRLRRMYARTRLEKEEVNILRGILSLMQKPNPLKHQNVSVKGIENK